MFHRCVSCSHNFAIFFTHHIAVRKPEAKSKTVSRGLKTLRLLKQKSSTLGRLSTGMGTAWVYYRQGVNNLNIECNVQQVHILFSQVGTEQVWIAS